MSAGDIVGDMPAARETRKASQRVADELKGEIMRGVLNRGDSLPSEALLVERFGVSRPTLREAIRILESEDLVRTSRGGRGGAKVRSPTVQRAAAYAGMVLQFEGATIRDVLRMRSAILPPAARLAAEHAETANMSALDDWLERNGSDRNDTRLMFKETQRLEALIVEIGGSKTMKFFSELLGNLTEAYMSEVPASLEQLPDFIIAEIPRARTLTRALVEAIKAGRAGDAYDLARQRMLLEEGTWDRRVAYNERLKLID
jgi:GntR family transcriptional repressor for pyruvate dehydrogenase complex